MDPCKGISEPGEGSLSTKSGGNGGGVGVGGGGGSTVLTATALSLVGSSTIVDGGMGVSSVKNGSEHASVASSITISNPNTRNHTRVERRQNRGIRLDIKNSIILEESHCPKQCHLLNKETQIRWDEFPRGIILYRGSICPQHENPLISAYIYDHSYRFWYNYCIISITL
jgi:hypothetical protein